MYGHNIYIYCPHSLMPPCWLCQQHVKQKTDLFGFFFWQRHIKHKMRKDVSGLLFFLLLVSFSRGLLQVRKTEVCKGCVCVFFFCLFVWSLLWRLYTIKRNWKPFDRRGYYYWQYIWPETGVQTHRCRGIIIIKVEIILAF